MTLLLAAVVAVHLLRTQTRAVTAFFLAMTGLAAYPRILATLSDDVVPFRTSISTPNFEVRASHIALVAVVLLVPSAVKRPNLSMPLMLATVLMAIVAIAQEDLPRHVLVGLLQWSFIALAWGVGSALAAEYRERRITDRALALLLAFPIAANGLAAALQVVGLRAVGSVDFGGEALSRVSGEQVHSGILGKILVLLVVLVLPLTRSSDAIARRIAFLSVAASFVLTGLTYSRANTVALVSLVGIWYLFGRDGSAARRIGLPIIVALAAAPFASVLLERNELDSQGGSRPLLLQAALMQLDETFWFGIGPNDYQATVGQFDYLSNSLPVHNAALLVLIESGAFIFLLIATPILATVVLAVRKRRAPGIEGLVASAIFAAIPGLAVVIYTGYSLASHHIAMLFFFVLGFSYRLMKPPPLSSECGRASEVQLLPNRSRV